MLKIQALPTQTIFEGSQSWPQHMFEIYFYVVAVFTAETSFVLVSWLYAWGEGKTAARWESIVSRAPPPPKPNISQKFHIGSLCLALRQHHINCEWERTVLPINWIEGRFGEKNTVLFWVSRKLNEGPIQSNYLELIWSLGLNGIQ